MMIILEHLILEFVIEKSFETAAQKFKFCGSWELFLHSHGEDTFIFLSALINASFFINFGD